MRAVNCSIAAEFLEPYQNYLEESGLLDFDDLLIKYEQLLREHPQTASFCQHILIDEFQVRLILFFWLFVYLCVPSVPQ